VEMALSTELSHSFLILKPQQNMVLILVEILVAFLSEILGSTIGIGTG
jgi:hypothetical protein